MPTIKLKELGPVKDLQGRDWDIFAENYSANLNTGEVTVNNIVAELHANNGEMLETKTANNLADMPDCFSQKTVLKLENHIFDLVEAES